MGRTGKKGWTGVDLYKDKRAKRRKGDARADGTRDEACNPSCRPPNHTQGMPAGCTCPPCPMQALAKPSLFHQGRGHSPFLELDEMGPLAKSGPKAIEIEEEKTRGRGLGNPNVCLAPFAKGPDVCVACIVALVSRRGTNKPPPHPKPRPNRFKGCTVHMGLALFTRPVRSTASKKDCRGLHLPQPHECSTIQGHLEQVSRPNLPFGGRWRQQHTPSNALSRSPGPCNKEKDGEKKKGE